jgi:hypothetical protein
MKVKIPTLWEGSEFQRSSRYDLEAGLSSVQSIAQRVKNANLIVAEFMRRGYPLGIALAAVVNARHESDLSNYAAGDSGRSIGLFQLYDSGAGKGMTIEERQDPYNNTKRIIEETDIYGKRSYSDGRTNLMTAYANGASIAELAVIFGRDIERPKNKGVGRDKTARSLFPMIADLPAKHLVKGAALGVILLTGASVVVAGGVIYYFWRRRNK